MTKLVILPQKIHFEKQPNMWEVATKQKKSQLPLKSSQICDLSANLATLIQMNKKLVFVLKNQPYSPTRNYSTWNSLSYPELPLPELPCPELLGLHGTTPPGTP